MQPIVLLFGVLRPYKGTEFLLRSWRQVQEQVPGGRLVVAGYAAPSYARQIRSLRRDLEIENSVEFRFRFLPEDELCDLIAAADVLVYPYRNITQSGALFAGMNAGKAIIATQVGGLREVLRDRQTGLLMEYGDRSQLAERLIRLLQDSEFRERLGQAAQMEIDESYSWKRIARRTLQCYAEL
jgi:glycosyltransferase involved in cell wall biosynthesis